MIKEILEYIDSSWISEQIWYIFDSSGRESKKVSEFIRRQLDNPEVYKIVVDNKWDTYADDDKKIIRILEWVINNIRYTSDIKQYKKVEYWASVSETLASRQGDCEDGALLLYALARESGIPTYKLKIIAGTVDGGTGHCWLRYMSEKYPYNAFYIDWCYYPDITPINKRVAYLDYHGKIFPGQTYNDIWFMADEVKGSKKYRW